MLGVRMYTYFFKAVAIQSHSAGHVSFAAVVTWLKTSSDRPTYCSTHDPEQWGLFSLSRNPKMHHNYLCYLWSERSPRLGLLNCMQK